MRGYAGSPNRKTGTRSSSGSNLRLHGGIFPFWRNLFKLEFENTLASGTLPGHYHNTQKTIFTVICCLYIKAEATLAIYLLSAVCRGLLYFDMGSVYGIQTLRELAISLVKVFNQITNVLFSEWKLDVLSSEMNGNRFARLSGNFGYNLTGIPKSI